MKQRIRRNAEKEMLHTGVAGENRKEDIRGINSKSPDMFLCKGCDRTLNAGGQAGLRIGNSIFASADHICPVDCLGIQGAGDMNSLSGNSVQKIGNNGGSSKVVGQNIGISRLFTDRKQGICLKNKKAFPRTGRIFVGNRKSGKLLKLLIKRCGCGKGNPYRFPCKLFQNG